MLAAELWGGAVVVIEKLALVAPPGTVMLGGTLASDGKPELSVTSTPPAGAGSESVTVPVAGFPPITGFGTRVTDLGIGGGVPHTLGVPVPPQIWGAMQVPQASHPPAPSGIAPQFFPWAVHVVGVRGPQTLATPPPPQIWGALQVPQVSVPPQPSEMVPQFLPSEAQVRRAQVPAGSGTTAR